MKAKFLLLLTVFFFQFLDAQSARQELITEVCACFENIPEETGFKVENLKECFDFTKDEYKSLMEKIVVQEIDTSDIGSKTSYEVGYDYGKKLFNEVQKPLIETCDSYYRFVKELKNVLVSNSIKGVTQSKLEDLQEAYTNGNASPDEILLVGINELFIGHHDSALQLFQNCLKKKSNHLMANFFLALTYNLKSEYELAVQSYNSIINQGIEPITSVAILFKEAALLDKN
ncbi:MAG: hypothetical protein COA80_14105 [Leeuwenhoekiella sp.]|nr:MAG: hypothetical protein COA80_14105 [Leeuwenhoekiella sp.]